MASGIKKRTGSDYSDGRPGRINYHSEDEYRTITLTLQATAEDIHDITHLRDAVNELFDDELMLREKRIKSVEVEYESMGQRTGELQLQAPEYVNGKQIKVAMVNSPEIDDTALVSTFTVEFETTESPYFETIYTTLELHDSGYSATAEKYGLVDNIDDEKVKYRFEPEISREELAKSEWEVGGIQSSTGANVVDTGTIRTKSYFKTIPGQEYVFEELLNSSKILYWWIMEYDNAGSYIGYFATQGNPQTNKGTFTARGSRVRMRPTLRSGQTVSVDDVGVNIRPTISGKGITTSFTVYNAGNVTIEPESSYLVISVTNMQSLSGFKITNKSTGEVHEHSQIMGVARDYEVRGLNTMRAGSNVFRYTNRRFISLKPGDNLIEVSGGTFSEINFDFKFMYK